MAWMWRLSALANPDLMMGIGARALFILVKPAALWAAIQLDSDSGMQLAQVYLVGTLALSLMGTNAHRSFYRARFEEAETAGVIATARRYQIYLEDLGRQILLVLVAITLIVAVASDALMDFVLIGLVFAVAEKISDEGIRYTQFCLDNRRLMIWALTKVAASATAVLFSLTVGLDIGWGFPVLLLVFVSLFTLADIRRALVAIQAGLRHGVTRFATSVFVLFRRDVGQIAWIFTSMSLMNLDKWTLQFLDQASLPKYMFVAQLAAAFIVAQTVFVLAPARRDLVNRNPWEVPSLRRGSWLFAIIAWFVGISIVFFTWYNSSGSLLHFPFFLAGICVLSAPFLERLYWVASDRLRVGIDIGFILLLAGIASGLRLWTGDWPGSHLSLTLLAIVLLMRLGTVSAIIGGLGKR